MSGRLREGLRRALLCAVWGGWMVGAAAMAQPVRLSPLPSVAGVQGNHDWWVDLSVPTADTVPVEQRHDQVLRVRTQQNHVARQVVALGGQVVGRMTQSRNTLAVRMRADRAAALSRLSGVRAVRPVNSAARPPSQVQSPPQQSQSGPAAPFNPPDIPMPELPAAEDD